MAAKEPSNSRTPQKPIDLGLLLRSIVRAKTALGMMVRITLLTAPVVAVPILAVPILNATSSTYFSSSFESGLSGWETRLLCCKDSAQIVSSPTREGKQAIKFILRRNDTKVRSELISPAVPVNSERWYGYSTFIPRDYEPGNNPDIISQWNTIPDRELGEKRGGRGPSLSLNIKNNRFGLGNNWNAEAVNVKNKGGYRTQDWDLGEITKGEWIDFVYHVKWSYKSDGLIEVWKNGKLVVRKNGPNIYNDKTGPYMKVGIYKPRWRQPVRRGDISERIIYFDAVRIGDANASYKDVAPRPFSTSPITFRNL